MLRLNAKPASRLIHLPAFSVDCAVKVVGRVKLHPRPIRKNIQYPSARRLGDAGDPAQFARPIIDNKIMIVTVAQFQLLVVLVDARADGGGLTKIKRRSVDGPEFASRNERRIHGCEAIRFDLDLVSKSIPVAGEIEVGMLGQVDNGRLVSGRGNIHAQAVGFVQAVNGFDIEVAGSSLLRRPLLKYASSNAGPVAMRAIVGCQTTLSNPLRPP